MPIMTKPSSAPSTALCYITIGAIMAVLAGTSYFFYDDPGHRFIGYIRTSFLILGIVLLVIGFAVGEISRSARKSELPPPEATPAVARESQAVGARGAVMQPVAPLPPNPGAPANRTVTQT